MTRAAVSRLLAALALVILAAVVRVKYASATALDVQTACRQVAAPLGYCGDGICDPYRGETATTCPQDCAPTKTPTLPPVTASYLSVSATPTVPTETPVPTSVPATTIAIPTESALPGGALTPTATPQFAQGSGVGGQPGCGLVPFVSRPLPWQRGYTVTSRDFIPKTPQQQEVYVCSVPPSGMVCIPVYDGLLAAVQGDQSQIMFVDCTADGKCQLHNNPVAQVGNAMCTVVSNTDNVSCAAGCAFVPQAPLLAGIPLPATPLFRQIAATAGLLPFACLALILIMAVIVLIIVAGRRRRGAESTTQTGTSGVNTE